MVSKTMKQLEQLTAERNRAVVKFDGCLKEIANAYEILTEPNTVFDALVGSLGYATTLGIIFSYTPREIIDAAIVRRLQGVGCRIALDDRRSISDIPRVPLVRRLKRDNDRAFKAAEQALGWK